MTATPPAAAPLRPIGWIGSLLYFGIPSAIFSASLLGLLPWMVRHRYGSLTIFNVTFGGPLALMLVAALVAYRLEGHPWTWPALRDRLRLQRPSAKDWLWTVALVVVSLGLGRLVGPVAQALSSIHLVTQPSEFSSYLATMQQSPFPDIDLKGRWDLVAWVVFALAVFNIGGEELWWRGIILPRQEPAFGKWAWLVNGLLWDLFHMFYHTSLGSVVGYLVATLPVAYVAQRTRNTWPGMVAHFIANLGIVQVMLPRVMG